MSIGTRQIVAYGQRADRFTSSTTYFITLKSKERYCKLYITLFDKSEMRFAFSAPGFLIEGGWSRIYIAKRPTSHHDRYTKITLSGMPADKIFVIRQEIEQLLRRYEIPDFAIKRFVDETGSYLRLAVKAARRRLALPAAPPRRWPEHRISGETPVDFVRRVYGKLIEDGGMTQADLAAVDKKALEALRNYCGYRYAGPKRPRASEILPSGKKNPDAVRKKYGKLTYANSIGAWRKNPTPENLERKRGYMALQTRKSRARNHDPT